MDRNRLERALLATHELTVERWIGAPPDAVFTGFFDMYERDRPDWIVESHLSLRVGGPWVVVFHPPGLRPFAETRVITELHPPRRLAYEMAVITEDGRPRFQTAVTLRCEPERAGTRVALRQCGFPTASLRDEFAAAWPDVLQLLERRVMV